MGQTYIQRKMSLSSLVDLRSISIIKKGKIDCSNFILPYIAKHAIKSMSHAANDKVWIPKATWKYDNIHYDRTPEDAISRLG